MPRISSSSLASRKTEILDDARECFIAYGYDGATVTRLEEATGKSRGAIFHHFHNKEELFLAVAHADLVEMAETAAEHGMIGMIRHILSSPDRAGWWGMRVEILRRVRNDPCFHTTWQIDQQALKTAVTERLVASQASGRVRSDVPSDTLYQVLDLLLEGVMTRLSTGVVTEQDVRSISQALDYVEKSLRVPGSTQSTGL